MKVCHPERVRMILEITHSKQRNSTNFCCVETVQENCANFSEFDCYSALEHEEPGVSPLVPKVNLCPFAMSVPAVHTANDKSSQQWPHLHRIFSEQKR
jgi:hypothetical protein